MAIDCPDNSTECLLRALISTTETQTSPWEPRNFGFTVAIGVAAFLISFVAIFQGLLAAGPGRIKASENAIGNFGKLTKGRLSLIEFAWRSTARVPLITYDSLRRGVEKQTIFCPHGVNYPFQAGSFNTGATWYHLLKCTGLHEEVDIIYEGNLQKCATDYLPADIQAPPAAIQLHCLAILVAIADPSVKFEKADRFLNITGLISQITFREHPVLGTTAAYECYQTKYSPEIEMYFTGYKQEIERIKRWGLPDESSHRPRGDKNHSIWPISLVKCRQLPSLPSTITKDEEQNPAPNASLGRCTPFALDLARGKLTLTWIFDPTIRAQHETVEFMDASTRGHRCSIAVRWHMPHNTMPMATSGSTEPFLRAIILMVARTDYEIRPFPWVMSGLSATADWLIEASRPYLVDVDTLTTYLESTGCQSDTGMGYDKRNLVDDSTFEIRGSWIVPGKPIYDIEGAFGEAYSKDLFETCVSIVKRFKGELEVKNVSDATHFMANYDKLIQGLWWFLKHVDILLRRKRFQAMDTLDALQRRIVNGYAAQEAAGNATQTVSAQHPAQPTQSDSSTRPSTPVTGPPVASATSRSSTSTAPSVGVRQSLQLSGSEASTSQGTSHDTLAARKSKVSEEECLECLLTIRGLLYAALLRCGPDTSMLWQPDFKNAIVKIM